MVVLCWNISFLLWISACIVFVAMLLWGFGRKLPVSPLKVLTIGTAAAVVRTFNSFPFFPLFLHEL